MTMLVMWLIEISLNQLGELRPQQDAQAKYNTLHEEFQEFLARKAVKVKTWEIYYEWISTT